MALRVDNGDWHQAKGTAVTSHIIKPGIATFEARALVEHVSLTALGHLGLRVARTAFTHFEDEPAIVVERFDRYSDDTGELRRVHQEDLSQSTSTLPTKKYSVKAEAAIRVLRGGNASEDLILEFVRAVLANWVLAAPDGHAKKYSVFLDPVGAAALSPLYDVSTGLGYPRSSELAMGFEGEKEIRKVTGRHVLQFARDVGIDGEHVLEAARAMAKIMPYAFAAAAVDAQATAEIGIEDQQWLNETNERLSAHCLHVENMLERTT